MRITYSAVGLGLVALAVGFTACNSGGETSTSTTTSTGAGGATSSAGSTTTTTTTATTSGDSATSSSVTGAGGAGGATSSSATTGTGGPVYGYCAKQCGTVVDCCPPTSSTGTGSPCPTNMYPNNPSCIKNACHSPQCATTADCAMQDPKQDCLVVSGEPFCGDTCASDVPKTCSGTTTCSGIDDNGKKYCLAPSGGGCTTDASCNGFGKCVNKVCVCEKASDCTKAGFTACAL